MKAEERKEIETNSLAKWLNKVWTGGGTRRSLYFYGAIILVVVLVIVGWNVWSKARAKDRAERWIRDENALKLTLPESTLKALAERRDQAMREGRRFNEEEEQANALRRQFEELAEDFRGTVPGFVAKIGLARFDLGPQGLDKLGTNDSEMRKRAAENIKRARDRYLETTAELKDEMVLRIEAWTGAAQAEEALMGVPQSEGSSEMVGNIDKVIEYYEKARQIVGDREYGKELAKLIEEKKAKRDEMASFYSKLEPQLRTPKLPFGGGLPPLPDFKHP